MTDPLDRLSSRAQKLYARVSNPRHWYQAYGSRTPAAMQELLDAGLVRRGSRMPVVNTYFVPTGYEMEYRERYPDGDGNVIGGGETNVFNRTYEDKPKT